MTDAGIGVAVCQAAFGAFFTTCPPYSDGQYDERFDADAHRAIAHRFGLAIRHKSDQRTAVIPAIVALGSYRLDTAIASKVERQVWWLIAAACRPVRSPLS